MFKNILKNITNVKNKKHKHQIKNVKKYNKLQKTWKIKKKHIKIKNYIHMKTQNKNMHKQ